MYYSMRQIWFLHFKLFINSLIGVLFGRFVTLLRGLKILRELRTLINRPPPPRRVVPYLAGYARKHEAESLPFRSTDYKA